MKGAWSPRERQEATISPDLSIEQVLQKRHEEAYSNAARREAAPQGARIMEKEM